MCHISPSVSVARLVQGTDGSPLFPGKWLHLQRSLLYREGLWRCGCPWKIMPCITSRGLIPTMGVSWLLVKQGGQTASPLDPTLSAVWRTAIKTRGQVFATFKGICPSWRLVLSQWLCLGRQLSLCWCLDLNGWLCLGWWPSLCQCLVLSLARYLSWGLYLSQRLCQSWRLGLQWWLSLHWWLCWWGKFCRGLHYCWQLVLCCHSDRSGLSLSIWLCLSGRLVLCQWVNLSGCLCLSWGLVLCGGLGWWIHPSRRMFLCWWLCLGRLNLCWCLSWWLCLGRWLSMCGCPCHWCGLDLRGRLILCWCLGSWWQLYNNWRQHLGGRLSFCGTFCLSRGPILTRCLGLSQGLSLHQRVALCWRWCLNAQFILCGCLCCCRRLSICECLCLSWRLCSG